MSIQKIIAATALIAAAGSALAESPYPVEKPFVSTRTRAEVVAEVAQAGGNLGRNNYQATFNPTAGAVSAKTRAEVVAELSNTRDIARQNYLTTTR